MLVAAQHCASSASANSAQQILDLQINLCYHIASILTLMYTIFRELLVCEGFVEKSTNLKWRQLEWWIWCINLHECLNWGTSLQIQIASDIFLLNVNFWFSSMLWFPHFSIWLLKNMNQDTLKLSSLNELIGKIEAYGLI